MVLVVNLFLLLASLPALAGHSDYTSSDSIRDSIEVSAPLWIAPSDHLPPGTRILPSNNNVSIALHEGRLFAAWRTAPTHFASKKTRILVAASSDQGQSWTIEKEIERGADIREPFLVSFQGKLILTCFEGGKSPFQFKPNHMMRTIRLSGGNWTELETFGAPGEVPWEIKERNGVLFMTSYLGDHYSAGKSSIGVRFSSSSDGIRWYPVNPDRPFIYRGGVSEVGFEFTENGEVWAVTRNEDGDDSGFGSHLIHSTDWGRGEWSIPSISDPNRYDSPRMFRHGNDLYLVARRDIGGPFWKVSKKLPFNTQKWFNLIGYSFRKKRTSLYRIHPDTRKIEWLLDLPSAGDNAFPSIVQKDDHTFWVANYTSPLNKQGFNWIEGQLSPKGTGIYLVEIRFRSANPAH